MAQRSIRSGSRRAPSNRLVIPWKHRSSAAGGRARQRRWVSPSSIARLRCCDGSRRRRHFRNLRYDRAPGRIAAASAATNRRLGFGLGLGINFEGGILLFSWKEIPKHGRQLFSKVASFSDGFKLPVDVLRITQLANPDSTHCYEAMFGINAVNHAVVAELVFPIPASEPRGGSTYPSGSKARRGRTRSVRRAPPDRPSRPPRRINAPRCRSSGNPTAAFDFTAPILEFCSGVDTERGASDPKKTGGPPYRRICGRRGTLRTRAAGPGQIEAR